MKIKVHLSIGYPGACHDDELEVPDDSTEDDLENETRDWAFNYIEYYYEKIEDKK